TPRRVIFRDRESAATGAAGRRRRRSKCRSIRPVDAHSVGSPTLEYHEPEPVWLIPGKEAGKIYRLGAFVPCGACAHATPSIEKLPCCQSLACRHYLGTPFA